MNPESRLRDSIFRHQNLKHHPLLPFQKKNHHSPISFQVYSSLGTRLLEFHFHVAKALPAPQKSSLTPSVPEDELEDMVKPKAAELALQEKPPPAKKRKGAVRISIPSLPQVS
jgi:hypothetical protein